MSRFSRMLAVVLCLSAVPTPAHARELAGDPPSADTVFVAAPTGERETDRANVQAAFDAVQPGGVVELAADQRARFVGTYVGTPAGETEPELVLTIRDEDGVLVTSGVHPRGREDAAVRQVLLPVDTALLAGTADLDGVFHLLDDRFRPVPSAAGPARIVYGFGDWHVVAELVRVQEPQERTDRFVRIDGARIHYLDFGGTGLPVLFTAGSRAAATWKDFAPRFTDEHRVLAITDRGVPPSEGQEAGYERRARDILALLDTLGIERAVLVANSNPAPILIYIAEHHPERVAGLVFLAPASEAGFESVHDPSGAMQMIERAFLSVQGGDPEHAGELDQEDLYRPRFLTRGGSISIPALTFVNREGTRGLAGYVYPLGVAAAVGSGALSIPDSVSRTFFERLARDEAMQRDVRAAWDSVFATAIRANEEAFFRAFRGNLRIVPIDVPLSDGVPVVTGYEYRDAPELITADVRRFLAEVRERESSRDTLAGDAAARAPAPRTHTVTIDGHVMRAQSRGFTDTPGSVRPSCTARSGTSASHTAAVTVGAAFARRHTGRVAGRHSRGADGGS